MSIADNIKHLRVSRGLSQKEFAVIAGVTDKAVSTWEASGKIPRMGAIQRIADYFNIKKSDIIEDHLSATPPASPVKIPVLGTVAAGVPMYAAENIIDEEEISAEMARDGEYFGLLIKGQSMEPKLYEGDVVIVRKQDFIENGETAIILINGDEATCKLVKEMPDGIMLIGHNTAVYEPHFYSRGEIDKLPVKVIGKVVELRRKF